MTCGYNILLFAALVLPIFAVPLQGYTVRLILQVQLSFTLTHLLDPAERCSSRTKR